MNNKNIDQKIAEILETVCQNFNINNSDPGLKYYVLTKLQEELGELAEQILKSDKYQRNDKGSFDRSELEHEYFDVLVTTLILGSSLGINTSEQLDSRIEKILKKRKSLNTPAQK